MSLPLFDSLFFWRSVTFISCLHSLLAGHCLNFYFKFIFRLILDSGFYIYFVMPPPRRKCVFNDTLAKNYPFLKKSKSESDVRCEICITEFNIGNAGKSDIEKHVHTEKHKKALNAVSKNRIVTNYFTSSADLTTSALEGVWAYVIQP